MSPEGNYSVRRADGSREVWGVAAASDRNADDGARRQKRRARGKKDKDLRRQAGPAPAPEPDAAAEAEDDDDQADRDHTIDHLA